MIIHKQIMKEVGKAGRTAIKRMRLLIEEAIVRLHSNLLSASLNFVTRFLSIIAQILQTLFKVLSALWQIRGIKPFLT